ARCSSLSMPGRSRHRSNVPIPPGPPVSGRENSACTPTARAAAANAGQRFAFSAVRSGRNTGIPEAWACRHGPSPRSICSPELVDTWSEPGMTRAVISSAAGPGCLAAEEAGLCRVPGSVHGRSRLVRAADLLDQLMAARGPRRVLLHGLAEELGDVLQPCVLCTTDVHRSAAPATLTLGPRHRCLTCTLAHQLMWLPDSSVLSW